MSSSKAATHGTRELLDLLHAAWSARDADGVARLFSESGVYSASVQNAAKAEARGRSEIRELVREMFAFDEGAETSIDREILHDGGAFWTWSYKMKDGTVRKGCDLLLVEDGQITLKDAYRKVV